MKNITIDCAEIPDKAALHQALAQALRFPEYYGNNLDALRDCLMEQADVEIEVQHEEEMLAALGRYGELLLQVLQDVKNR